MPNPSRIRGRRITMTAAGCAALTVVALAAAPSSGVEPTPPQLTQFAPSGDGGPADQAGLGLGASWTVFGAGPDQKATAPTAAGFDRVVNGRTVKHIAVSFAANPDVATENAVNLTATSENSGQTFLTTQPTDWTSLSYLRLADGSIKQVNFIPEWADAAHTSVVLDVGTSTDLGKTWTKNKAPVTPPAGKVFAMDRGLRITHGLIELADGTLLQPAYTAYKGDPTWTTILLQSTDKGASWTVRSTIATSASVDLNINESTVSYTRSGDRLVALVRQGTGAGTALVHPLLQTFSDDLGKTWSTPKEMVDSTGKPVDGIQPVMVLQPNGMLLLATGRPDNRVYVSKDGTGDRWDLDATVFSNSPVTTNTEVGNAGQERYFGSGGNASMMNVESNRTLFFYDTCITNNWCHSYNEMYSIGTRYVDAVTPGTGKLDIMSRLLDGTDTVSGDFTAADATYPEQRPQGAFDGSSSPRSATVLQRSDSTKPSMVLKLDQPYRLDKLGIMLGQGQPLNADLQFSVDGRAWGQPDIKIRGAKDHAMGYHEFAPQTVQYVKITGDAGVATPITELELYSTDTDTFENDPVLGIPRGWSDSTNVNVQTISPGGFHSQRAIRVEDRYTDQLATITKKITDSPYQVSDFKLLYEFGGDPLYFAVQGHTAGSDPVDRWNFRITDPQTAAPKVQARSGGSWQTIGTLPGFAVTDVAHPANANWHSVHINASVDKADLTIDGHSFSTTLADQDANALSGLRFYSDGMDLYHTEMWIDDVTVLGHHQAEPTLDGLSVDATSLSPGTPVTVSTTLTNKARVTASSPTASLLVPDGWTVTPTRLPGVVPPGRPITISWKVTPPAGTEPGTYPLSAQAGYDVGTEHFTVTSPTTNVAVGIVPRQLITATATSAQNPGNSPDKAIDGNNGTFWHTQYSPTVPPLPQSITLDLGSNYSVTGLRYLPRQDGSPNGIITSYSVSASTDGSTFRPVVSGKWTSDATAKSTQFAATGARYLRLQADAGTGGFASAAEITVLGSSS